MTAFCGKIPWKESARSLRQQASHLGAPAVYLAVGLACATSPARAQDAHDTPFNAYYSGTIATGDASGPMVPELASGWGGGWFFGDSTAIFRDLLDTSTAPGTFGNGIWIIFQA